LQPLELMTRGQTCVVWIKAALREKVTRNGLDTSSSGYIYWMKQDANAAWTV
jgi:hypothetical protein